MTNYDDAAILKNSIYNRDCAGCCFHIVLDEGNLEDNNIKYCMNYALSNQDCQNEDCLKIGKILLSLSDSERKQLYVFGDPKQIVENYLEYLNEQKIHKELFDKYGRQRTIGYNINEYQETLSVSNYIKRCYFSNHYDDIEAKVMKILEMKAFL